MFLLLISALKFCIPVIISAALLTNATLAKPKTSDMSVIAKSICMAKKGVRKIITVNGSLALNNWWYKDCSFFLNLEINSLNPLLLCFLNR